MSGLIVNQGKIWLSVEPVDMRSGLHSLTMIAQESLGQAPRPGSAVVFCNRARNRLKVLIWDVTGVWLCTRQLHKGKFSWPETNETSFVLTEEQWNWMIMGADSKQVMALENDMPFLEEKNG